MCIYTDLSAYREEHISISQKEGKSPYIRILLANVSRANLLYPGSHTDIKSSYLGVKLYSIL